MQFHCGIQSGGVPSWRPNSGGEPLNKDSKLCLIVALVVMAYILNIQQGLEKKVEKKKIYKNKPSQLAISYFRQGLSIIKAKIWYLRKFIDILNEIFQNTD